MLFVLITLCLSILLACRNNKYTIDYPVYQVQELYKSDLIFAAKRAIYSHDTICYVDNIFNRSGKNFKPIILKDTVFNAIEVIDTVVKVNKAPQSLCIYINSDSIFINNKTHE